MQDDDAATYVAQSGLREDYFLKRKCRLLYSIILNIRLTQGTCNFDFVVDSCEKKVLPNGQTILDFIGGVPAITKIISSPIATDLKTTEGYVNLVFKNWQWAKIKESVLKINGLSGADDPKLIDIISDTQSILTNSLQKHGLVSWNVLLPEAYLRYEDRLANPEKYEGLKTGFYWLDKYRAVSKKHTTVIGAKTNVGKTSFASQLAVSFALNGANVLIFTPEMDKEEYIDRIVCTSTGTHLDDWKAAQIKESDVNKISAFQISVLNTHPDSIYIDDKGSQTVGYILSSLKRHMLSRPVDVVIVDYIQKLRFYGENIRREVDDAMDKLSAFAKDNNIAMIILSQLRRTKEALPTKEDLKESGNLEIFADVVILIHRNPLAVNIKESRYAWYKIDKNRIGQNTNPVELVYHQDTLKFTEAELPPSEIVENPTIEVTEQATMEFVEQENDRLAGKHE
jgi:replicative DNA helicase